MTKSALSHLKVLDLTQYIAGPYCTKLMAGFGAEVIKVERPGTGDRMRALGPFFQDREDLETSIPFLWLNTGKKSITLNLKRPRGIEILKRLVTGADVLIESFSPGVMDSLGLGYDVLGELNPGLVMTSISSFGQTGPYRHYEAEEIQLNALGGGMMMTGNPDNAPLASGPALYQYTAGQHAYVATLMAVCQRDATGEGQHVDVSIQESGLEHLEITLSEYLLKGRNAKRGGHLFVPWDTYECEDGYATIIAMPSRHWHRASEIFQDGAIFDDEYHHLLGRIRNRREYESRLKDCVKLHKKKALFEAGQARRLAFAFLADLDEAIESPQHEDRKFFVEVDHPSVGKHRICGAPFLMSETPWKSDRAPLLGEHNHVRLWRRARLLEGRNPGFAERRGDLTGSLPLQGMRVIDLSHSWAAPHCTRILADYGAEVIKVEYIRRLCLLRGARKESEVYNRHPGWLQVNRNKYSITLDLKADEDREVLRDLIRTCDVLVENARTGVMDKLGFGYGDVKRMKNDVIMLSMSAFGNTGPYASYAGYGAVFEALGGIQGLTAYDRSSKPCRIKEMDVINGLAGACAVMTALWYRQRTGMGQHIDLSQLEASTHATIGEHLLEYMLNGTQTLPLGNRHRTFAPQGCYPCEGEDKWVVITIRSDQAWERFCEVVEHPEWISDARFATHEARIENHDLLDQMIGEWTRRRTHYEAMHALQDVGLPAAAVLDVSEIGQDPHLKERGYFVNRVGGPGERFMGMPFKLSKGEGRIRWRGPNLGEHNTYVFCELLKRSSDEIKPFRKEDIGTAFDPE